MNKYDYPTAFSLWGCEEQKAIARVFASGQFTMGPEVACFEQEYAAYHRRKHCVMVNSGSSANLIMVAALFHLPVDRLERGDKVIVPAIAWSTTYAPLVQHGLDLVLADVDETWNAPAGGLSSAKPAAVVGCSILGNPAYLPQWQRDISAYAMWADRPCCLINDDCESLGATLDGRTTASYGLMASSSFFHSHQLSAIEGGAVLTDDDECYRLLKMLRAHGWTRDTKKPATFADEYDFQLFGYNLRPLELHAAIAREQLKKLPSFIEARRLNYRHFLEVAHGLPLTRPESIGTPSPFGLQFTVESPDVRQRLVTALRAAGIDCRLPTGGSFRLHAYGQPWRGQATPRADHIHTHGLFLGNAPYDIRDKIERAVKVMREVL